MDTNRQLLIILSPTCPPYASPKSMAYAPIAVIGPGFKPGLLTSASTRRPGFVSNTDIAPTVLEHFGIDVPRGGKDGGAGMSGRPMGWRAGGQPLRDVRAISRRGVRLVQLRWRFGPVYALGQFFIFIGVGAALAFRPQRALTARRRLRLILLLGMSLPLALLLLPVLDPGGLVQPYVIAAALAAAFAWLASYRSPPMTALGALLAATAGVIAIDAVTGARLLGNCVISYNPMFGGRFHGIGNDVMGAAIACAAIGSTALAQQRGGGRGTVWMLGLWLMLVGLAIGAPYWGANWGGGVTAAFAFTITWMAVRRGRPRLRHWVAGLAAAAAAGTALMALDLLGDARTWTHFGDSAHAMRTAGITAAAQIAARKFAANLHIFAIAPYNGMTLAVLAATLWLVMRPPARLAAVLAVRPALWAGLAGSTAGAFVAVIVNDSGIVAGASALGTIACAIAYAALEENRPTS
ncbi:MAG: hypothetical protein JSV65_00430 [Armatimonadota bacterium]|nr:MAG: hypothetical protein JSV65_00430 [Armatimonadota bacterium]